MELGSAVEQRWHVIVVEPIRHAESTFLCHSSTHSLISAAHNLPDEVFPDLKAQNLVGVPEAADKHSIEARSNTPWRTLTLSSRPLKTGLSSEAELMILYCPWMGTAS